VGGNIVFGSQGALESFGGAITLNARHSPISGPNRGTIFMADGAVIDAQTGTISMTAVGDITLGHVVDSNGGPVAVFIATTQGGIVNGGNSAGQNIGAPRVELEAGFGIGSSTGLQTAISTLAASNLYAGN